MDIFQRGLIRLMLFAEGQLFGMERERITYFEALHTLGVIFLLHPVTDL
jgi:hypothetical protein